MDKFQTRFIVFVVLAMLTIMGVLSTEKVAPITLEPNEESGVKTSNKINVLPSEKKSLAILSKTMTKIILGYVEIHTGFEYILQTHAFYHTLQTTLTEVAYAQYHAFLTTANPRQSSPTLLQRYVHFLRTPLDPTTPFPEPTVLVLSRLPTPHILCSTLRAHPETTEAMIADFFHTRAPLHAYDRTAQGMGDNYLEACRSQFSWKKKLLVDGLRSWSSLPFVYDPRQTLLHLYPMAATHAHHRLFIRLPAVLLFWTVADQHSPIHTEHVWTWLGGVWMYMGGLSFITWYNVESEWIFETFFSKDGVMQKLRVINPNRKHRQCTFTTVDGGTAYTMLSSHMANDFGYTHMVPFYYPRAPANPSKHVPIDISTDKTLDKKKQLGCCCNIV